MNSSTNFRKQLSKPIFYGLFSGLLFAFLQLLSSEGEFDIVSFAMDLVGFGVLMGLFKFWTDKKDKQKEE